MSFWVLCDHGGYLGKLCRGERKAEIVFFGSGNRCGGKNFQMDVKSGALLMIWWKAGLSASLGGWQSGCRFM